MGDVQHFDDVLFAFVLGCLSPAETTGIHVHLKSCRRCAHRLKQVRDDTAQLALALPPSPAPALIRESLLHSIGEINRFLDWAEPLSVHLGCAPAIAQAWLNNLDNLTLWDDSLEVGMRTLSVPAPWNGSFVRLQAGTQVPHEEGTSPTLFILQGNAFDSSGATYRPGDVLQLRPDEHAEISARATGPDLIYLSTPHSAPIRNPGGSRLNHSTRPPLLPATFARH